MLMIPFILVVLLIGWFLHIIPVRTRPDLFFAVTVMPQFHQTAEARRVLWVYRVIVWAATFFAIGLTFVTGATQEALLIQMAGFLGALAYSHRQTLPHSTPSNPIVEVDLAAPEERLPAGLFILLLPVFSLGILALWVNQHRKDLPPRFPTHWGIYGAGHWVITTPAKVFGFLAFQASLCLFLVFVALAVLHWSRHISSAGAAAAPERRFRRRILELIIVTDYIVACSTWFALLWHSPIAMKLWSLGIVVVVIAFTVIIMRTGQGGSRAVDVTGTAPVSDRTPDACWTLGIFYINPADPAIFVEKRFGFGYTLNFGNRWAWVVLMLVVGLVVVGRIILR